MMVDLLFTPCCQ